VADQYLYRLLETDVVESHHEPDESPVILAGLHCLQCQICFVDENEKRSVPPQRGQGPTYSAPCRRMQARTRRCASTDAIVLRLKARP
jgi:hypothetical protein